MSGDQFFLDYTNRMLVWHWLLAEDHLLDYSVEPTRQCLACLYWHLEKIIAYVSLECVKFASGFNEQLCREMVSKAEEMQAKLETMAKDEAKLFALVARDLRYKLASAEEQPSLEEAKVLEPVVMASNPEPALPAGHPSGCELVELTRDKCHSQSPWRTTKGCDILLTELFGQECRGQPPGHILGLKSNPGGEVAMSSNPTTKTKEWSSPLNAEEIDTFYDWIDRASSEELLTELCRRADYMGAQLAGEGACEEGDVECEARYPFRGSGEVYTELGTLRHICWKLTGKLPSSVVILGGHSSNPLTRKGDFVRDIIGLELDFGLIKEDHASLIERARILFAETPEFLERTWRDYFVRRNRRGRDIEDAVHEARAGKGVAVGSNPGIGEALGTGAGIGVGLVIAQKVLEKEEGNPWTPPPGAIEHPDYYEVDGSYLSKVHGVALSSCEVEHGLAGKLDSCITKVQERNLERSCPPGGLGTAECPLSYAVCRASISVPVCGRLTED